MTSNRYTQKTATMDLINGPVGKTLLLFSLPFMLSTLLQTLYTTADTIIVGQYLGKVGLSAVSNGSQLMNFADAILFGFSGAGQVLIAQSEGAGNRRKTERLIGTLFLFMLAVSFLVGGVFAAFYDTFLGILRTPGESRNQAGSYVLICSLGIVFTGLYNMVSTVLRGMGDSRHPLLFVVIASIINIVLDIVFIKVFELGVAGTALATIIGQACSVVFSVVFLLRHRETFGLRLTAETLRADMQSCIQILKLGIPLSIQHSAVQTSFLFVSGMINTLGVSVSAAFGVTQKLRNIPNVLTQGIGTGSCSMAGQNLGARKNDRAEQVIRTAIGYCAVISGINIVILLLKPELCFRIFTQDADVLALARMCTLALALEMPARMVMPPCGALISAQGNIKVSMAIGFADAFVGRIFCSWFFGIFLGMGAFGFLIGYGAGTYLTAIPGFLYFITGKWKKRGALISKEE